MTARDANSTEIKPLTKRTRQGVLYVRRVDAEIQIKKVLALGEPQILAMISAGRYRDDPDYLLDETIVYLLREAKIAGNSRMIENLYLELNRRIWKLLSGGSTG